MEVNFYEMYLEEMALIPVLDAQSKEEPGTIVEVNKKEIIVATGSNDLALHEIQLAGKKRMQVRAFLLGYQVEAGTKLGE